MAGEFAVFTATPGDGAAVGEIHAESWQTAYAPFFAPEFFADAVRVRRTRWHDVLAETRDTILLAALDGRPLAFSYFGPSHTRPGSAEIFGFYGHPDGWGSGLAAVLMTASLERISADDYPHIHLWTLRDTLQSRRFYAKAGFTESGVTRTHDYGDGHPLHQVEYELTQGSPEGTR
ncbi:GNAT family N-acetyltransferase [Streptosporangiaceae bacterium NEAU-GS5]|nr:GNAT family N-acetyltransferase [Streptosporangiaceae bacterium NEAU-GS5]